jgi:hypothetical protein
VALKDDGGAFPNADFGGIFPNADSLRLQLRNQDSSFLVEGLSSSSADFLQNLRSLEITVDALHSPSNESTCHSLLPRYLLQAQPRRTLYEAACACSGVHQRSVVRFMSLFWPGCLQDCDARVAGMLLALLAN